MTTLNIVHVMESSYVGVRSLLDPQPTHSILIKREDDGKLRGQDKKRGSTFIKIQLQQLLHTGGEYEGGHREKRGGNESIYEETRWEEETRGEEETGTVCHLLLSSFTLLVVTMANLWGVS